MSARRIDAPLDDPHAQLERVLIDEFLLVRGYDPVKLHELPQATATALMKEAVLHAALRLAEIEARAHFVHEIHGSSR